MTRYLSVLLACTALTACGPIPVKPDAGQYFTVEHGTGAFPRAQAGAEAHCKKLEMRARHLGSDHAADVFGSHMMSRFECVPA